MTKIGALGWVLVATAVGLLIWAIPARAASPCDSSTVLTDAQDSLRSDCEALWAFYTNLDDPGVLGDPSNSNAWRPTTPLARWQGVVIGSTGVEGLLLPDAGLRGSISPRIGELATLERLVLYDNRLTGSIPASIGQLKSLKILAAHRNRLTGPIPAELGDLPKLSDLILHTNRLTGTLPADLRNLGELTYLDISNNNLEGRIPGDLGRLSNLTHLKLNGNFFVGTIPETLGKLSLLEVLDLAYNQLTGPVPEQLGSLAHLRVLNLRGNQIARPVPEGLKHLVRYLLPVTTDRPDPHTQEPTDPFASDPLVLIARADIYRYYSLQDEVWKVWFCESSDGDLALSSSHIISILNQNISPYYNWISDGHYDPVFEYEDKVGASNTSECIDLVYGQERKPNRVLIIDNTDLDWGFGSLDLVFVGGGTVVASSTFSEPRLSTIAHEIGHALGFPHAYGGKITWRGGQIYEYDNPMDIVTGEIGRGLTLGTIAVNRYAAGWIDPEGVAVHERGTSEVYELQPVGGGGIQMLVLPGEHQGLFTALGARVRAGYDSAVPKEGVEVYRVDQRSSACRSPDWGGCWGILRRTQPYPPPAPEARADLFAYRVTPLATRHVYRVGDSFEVGAVTIEIVDRMGDNFNVRVTDPRIPLVDPDSAHTGRFADDDGNVHEANIEVIAGLRITLGCNPPGNDRYCPGAQVTRAQMMVFLARALGQAGNPEAAVSRFSDVPPNAWYLPSLERLAELGIARPSENGTFRPDEPLTRRDMAVFLTRAFPRIWEVARPKGVFSDIPPDDPHAGAIEGIRLAGVTSGCGTAPLSFCPDEPVRRDQMASFLVRALRARTGQTAGSEWIGGPRHARVA